MPQHGRLRDAQVSMDKQPIKKHLTPPISDSRVGESLTKSTNSAADWGGAIADKKLVDEK